MKTAFTLGKTMIGRELNAECMSDETGKKLSEVTSALIRHSRGDWGDLCEEDKQANEEALKIGSRIISRYNFDWGDIYIITEADRSYTTCLFCHEY